MKSSGRESAAIAFPRHVDGYEAEAHHRFMVIHLQPDSLLLAGDVARVFSVSAGAVRKWERSGRISAERTVGGARVFRGSEVLRFQQLRAMPPTTLPSSTR